MRPRDVMRLIGIAWVTPMAGVGLPASFAVPVRPTVNDCRVLETVSAQAEFRPHPEDVAMKPTSIEKQGRVEIRIKNGSDVDFDRVRVDFPDEREVDYGPAPKGGVTAFHRVSRAYRYAGFSVKAGKQELSLQPIDYMGEQELPAGRYTYVLGVDKGRLTVRLEKAD